MDRRRNRRQMVDIVLITDELLQDLKVEGAVQAEKVVSEDPRQKTLLQDICESTNIEKVTRQMNLAVEDAADRLYPYTKELIMMPTTLVTDKYRAPELYRLKMTVPVEMSMTTVNLLRTLVHEYVVSRVMQEWCRVNLPEVYASWTERVLEIAGRIDAAKNRRVGLVRRRMSVY